MVNSSIHAGLFPIFPWLPTRVEGIISLRVIKFVFALLHIEFGIMDSINKHHMSSSSRSRVPVSLQDHLFLRPKKNGNMRPVFNLKPLNAFVTYEHLKWRDAQLYGSCKEKRWDVHNRYDRRVLQCYHSAEGPHIKYVPVLLRNKRASSNLLKPVVSLPHGVEILLLLYLNNMCAAPKPSTFTTKCHTDI